MPLKEEQKQRDCHIEWNFTERNFCIHSILGKEHGAHLDLKTSSLYFPLLKDHRDPIMGIWVTSPLSYFLLKGGNVEPKKWGWGPHVHELVTLFNYHSWKVSREEGDSLDGEDRGQDIQLVYPYLFLLSTVREPRPESIKFYIWNSSFQALTLEW